MDDNHTFLFAGMKGEIYSVISKGIQINVAAGGENGEEVYRSIAVNNTR